ncbi:MAG: hypothetical protein IE909_14400, partial [Campylobacterales bacterium]|nr:hypothetical protein [Campylobacterales bacterium]
FLADYENLEFILEDVEEIDTVLFDLITSLDVATIDQQKEDLRFALGKYTTFLNSLMLFGDLSNSLRTLADQVESIDIEEYEDLQATFIVELLRAILQDLSQWKEFVFIDQTAQDVYYINASVICNCEQLQRAINNK